MVAGVFSAIPAQAQVVPEVPATVNIEDAADDANYGGAPASLTRADILKVWFTETPDWFLTHIQTTAAGNDPNAILYRVWIDAGQGECLQIRGFTAGLTSPNPSSAPGSLRQTCDGDTTVAGEFFQVTGPDETGIRTIALPRDAHPAFTAGTTLTPRAETTNWTVAVTAPQIDGTDVGIPYVVTGGGDGEPVDVGEPPVGDEVKEEKPLTKADCKKIKNKRKRRRCFKKLKAQNQPPPATDACAAYEPGEQGAEAESVVVTDENTEEAPLELTIEHGGPALAAADTRSHVFSNIQVDTTAAENGLYMRYEFPDYEDHDLYLNYADGSQAAQVAGGNQLALDPGLEEGTGNGGHSEVGAEVLDGLRTADCAGYTADLVNFLGEGGEYTVTLWLGEIQNDPAPPASARAALELMQGTLG
jgi:hypothetical protein